MVDLWYILGYRKVYKGGLMESMKPVFSVKTPIGLFDKKGAVKVDRLMNFMDISRSELATAFGLTGDQLRPERIATRTKEMIGELAGAIEQVANTFSGNEEKTRKWFNLPNAHFGGSAPKKVILSGRFRRVKSFIYSSQSR